MRVAVDVGFLRDVERFALRFTCRDCFHFRERDGACAHEWPNDEHRDPPAELVAGRAATVLFCKEFELR